MSTFGMQAALKELEEAALAAERAEAGEACADAEPMQAGSVQSKKGGKAKGGRKITGKVSHERNWAPTCSCGLSLSRKDLCA